MKTIAWALIFFADSSAWAGFSIGLDYACLSIDGVPIAKGTDLAAKCCVADPGPECRVGFSSVGPAAAEDSMGYLDVVREGIKNAAALNGVDLDHRDPSQLTRVTGAGNPNPDGNALVAGKSTDAEALSGLKLGQSGTRTGGGISGAGKGYDGGITGAQDLAGATRGRESPQGGAGDFGGGKYLGSAGNASNAGADGKSAEVGVGDVQELKYGEAGNRGGSDTGTLNPDGSDSEGMSGSREDAPDYLNRIEKSASIFKIVSKRYEKELARNRLRIPEIKAQIK